MQAFCCPPYGQPNDQRVGRPGSCTVASRAARVTTNHVECTSKPCSIDGENGGSETNLAKPTCTNHQQNSHLVVAH